MTLAAMNHGSPYKTMPTGGALALHIATWGPVIFPSPTHPPTSTSR